MRADFKSKILKRESMLYVSKYFSKFAKTGLLFAAAVFISGMTASPLKADITEKPPIRTSRVVAEWDIDLGKTAVSDLGCDEKTLLIVDYLISEEDGAYLGVTTLTVVNKNSMILTNNTIDLENEISTPQLILYNRGYVYFMTVLADKYFVTAFRLIRNKFIKAGELQFDSQMNVSMMGTQIMISTNSAPDEAGNITLTTQIYDLNLSRKLKELSCQGNYPSITPAGFPNVTSWEVRNMTADKDGGISGINIKIMK
jgi:hypothetical protein